MLKGDIFNIEANEIRGYHISWGKLKNKEETKKNINEGIFYVINILEGNYLIGEIFQLNKEFSILGEKHTYLINKTELNNKKVIDNIRNHGEHYGLDDDNDICQS